MTDSVFTAAYEQLVSAVVRVRKAAGLTQRDLAAKLDREQSFIGRVETGQRRLDMVEFVWICRACGADPEQEVVRLVKAIGTKLPPGRRR